MSYGVQVSFLKYCNSGLVFIKETEWIIEPRTPQRSNNAATFLPMLEQTLPGEEHPLLLELKSTRAAVARFQEEAHVASVRLQRHSLESTELHERSHRLQQENDLLKTELTSLRSSSTVPNTLSTSNAQIQELTLSLRKLSHKLSLTEEALLRKTEAWQTARADFTKTRIAKEAADELSAMFRGRGEAEKAKVRDLEQRVQMLEAEKKMLDFTIKEYAALVRDMEVRPKSVDSADSQTDGPAKPILISTLSEGRLKLQHIIDDFRSRHEVMFRELEKSQGEFEQSQSRLDSEKKYERALIIELTEAKTELEKLKINDDTASKMVARYMQFSQSSSNNLLASVNTLKARHAATVTTLTSQNHLLASQIRSLQTQNDHLRSLLDDLGGEIMKEKYGRRREVSLRIRMGGRQEKVAESLRRWVRKGEEAVRRVERGDLQTFEGNESAYGDLRDSLLSLSQDARILLESLEEGGIDEEAALSVSGARARELMVFDGIDGLLEELRLETEKRLMLQATLRMDGATVADTMPTDAQKGVSQKSWDIPVFAGSLTEVPVEDGHIGHTSKFRLEVGEDAAKSHSDLAQETPSLTSESKKQTTMFTHTETTSPPTSTYETTQIEDNSHSVDLPYFSSPHENADGNLPKPSILPFAEQPALYTDSNPVNHGVDLSSDAFSPQHASSISQWKTVISSSSPSNTSLPQGHKEAIVQDKYSYHCSSPDDPAESPLPLEPTLQTEIHPHPLITGLASASKRYNVYQRSFGDCHIALEGLKASLTSNIVRSNSSTQPHLIPLEILSAVVTRLDDFTEDVRVELEIKISDEILLAKGYEALLRVPGALKSFRSETDGFGGGNGDSPSVTAIEHQIAAFVDGTDLMVRKATEMFAKKLDHVQHDIAILKKAVYDPQSLFEDHSISASNSVASWKEDYPKQNGGWTALITGSSARPLTPNSVLGPSQTFGDIMTSPRLRNSPSLDSAAMDPMSILGLKIPMPSTNQVESFGASPTSLSTGGRSLLSPIYPASLGIGPPPINSPKSRTLSAMYRLGLNSGENICRGTGTFSRTVSTSSSWDSLPLSQPGLTGVHELEEAKPVWDSSEHDVE